MTREQIKRVASEAALSMKFRSDIHPSQQGEALFIDGAQWRINSVWHDNSVRPGEDCDVLVETKHRIILDRYDTDYNELDSGTDWETEVIRWAHVSDLLPERKEEAKMKAKIKATGEIINIADYARVVLSQCNSRGNPIELGFDEVEILQEDTSDIDWE